MIRHFSAFYFPSPPGGLPDGESFLLGVLQFHKAGSAPASVNVVSTILTSGDGIVQAGLQCIPEQSQYAGMVRDMLAWYEKNPDDWQQTWLMRA